MISSVETVIRQHFGSYSESGSEISVACPFCPKRDGKKKLYINVEKGVYNCFRCGETGGIRALLRFMGKEHITLAPASKREVAIAHNTEDGGIPLNKKTKGVLGDMALNYLRGRGLDDKLIDSLDLRYYISGKYKDRIRFPVRNADGDDVFCLYRAFAASIEPKVMFPHTGDTLARKSEAMFGLFEAKRNTTIYIVEGEFDALTLWGNAVALLGSYMSKAQEGLIINTFDSSVTLNVLLDGDKPKEAMDICERLALHMDNVYFVPLGKLDPNDLGREGVMHYAVTKRKKVS